MNLQTSTLVGKYAPLSNIAICMDGFYNRRHRKQYIIMGDEAGCLQFVEIGENWHVCNDVFS